MSTFTPEFAQQWLAAPAGDGDGWRDCTDDDIGSPSQQEALMELADRVSAARSVV